jgi:hypothetical protein
MLHFIQSIRRPGPVEVLPPGWAERPGHGPVARESKTYVSAGGLRVIHSLDTLADGSTWDHLSVSRIGLLPSWDDLVMVKEVFIGCEREALQLFPKRSEYINVCEFCLHIWARVNQSRVVLKEGAA